MTQWLPGVSQPGSSRAQGHGVFVGSRLCPPSGETALGRSGAELTASGLLGAVNPPLCSRKGLHEHPSDGFAFAFQDVSRKHHTWKEQAPWLSALVKAVGTGVPAKGSPGGAVGQPGWNPPRCGVPDLPLVPDGQSGRNRQKRFVLSGGRWDKTNLTYR